MSLHAAFSERQAALPAMAGEPFLRAFLGSIVLLFAVRTAEPVFFGDGYYATLSAHPFWIIVLLAAVQSGLFAGVATAAMATLMMDWPPRPVGADITAYYVELATIPVMWILTAIVVGGFRQTQLREFSALQHDHARLSGMNEDLAEEILRMDKVMSRLELNAATGRADSAGSASGPWRALRAVGEAGEEELPHCLAEAAEVLGLGNIAALIRDDENRLVPLGEATWLDAGRYAALGESVDDDVFVTEPVEREGETLLRCNLRMPDGQAAMLVARVDISGIEGGKVSEEACLDILTLLARQIEAALRHQSEASNPPRADFAPYLAHPIAAAE